MELYVLIAGLISKLLINLDRYSVTVVDVVKMAYIQLSLLGIDAVIMQGDSITQKMNEVWYTPMHFMNLAREQECQSNDNAERMLKIIRDLEALESPKEKELVGVVPGQMNMFDLGVM